MDTRNSAVSINVSVKVDILVTSVSGDKWRRLFNFNIMYDSMSEGFLIAGDSFH